jgi:hypothetical protein
VPSVIAIDLLDSEELKRQLREAKKAGSKTLAGRNRLLQAGERF